MRRTQQALGSAVIDSPVLTTRAVSSCTGSDAMIIGLHIDLPAVPDVAAKDVRLGLVEVEPSLQQDQCRR